MSTTGPSRKFRLGLQGKVLIAVVGFLILVPAVAFWVMHRQMQQQMEDEALRTLTTAESIFTKTLEDRTRSVVMRYRTVASEARFRVTAELGDPRTFDSLLGNLLADSPDEHEALLFLNDRGELVASRRRATSIDPARIAQAVQAVTRVAMTGEGALGYAGVDGRAYSVAAVPVTAREGERRIGVLAVAVRLGETALQEIALPRTEILLLAENGVKVATAAGLDVPEAMLSEDALRGNADVRMRPGAGVSNVVLRGEHFLARAGRVGGVQLGQAGVRYVMLSSYEARLRALDETRRLLLWIGVGGVVASALLVSWYVRRLIRPLHALSAVADSVGRGDFTRRIEQQSNDECGDLAAAFNRMTEGLENSRTELERATRQVKATQEQLIQSEKLSAVGQFVAGVAHELNNPLTAVVGYAELLQTTPPSEKTRGYFDRIAKSAHRCHRIVHSLLSFARQHPPERKLVDLHSALSEVLEIMAYDLRTGNVSIVREFAPELPPVMADPHQLQQVFVNILGNARQAMESFQRDGRVVLRSFHRDGAVVIEFQDNGPGIKPSDLARIFDPFFTTKPVGKGTGLGLSLCYGIIQEHEGRIFARSEPGQGATFVIELPVAQNATPTAAPRGYSVPPFLATTREPSGKSVLIIDDESWILDLAAELLRCDGHAVDTATSGLDALECIGRRRYDAIVSDWKMPGLNGMRLYEHLRATDPQAAGRVIFMTGDVVNESFQEFLRANQLKCLPKPFATGEFRTLVAQMAGHELAVG